MAFDWIEAYYFGIEYGNGRLMDTVNVQVRIPSRKSWLRIPPRVEFKINFRFFFLVFCSEYYWCMLIGRGLGGISVGALHLLIPMYINDIASAEQKPLYHTIAQLQFVIGILSQYILSEYYCRRDSISAFTGARKIVKKKIRVSWGGEKKSQFN